MHHYDRTLNNNCHGRTLIGFADTAMDDIDVILTRLNGRS